MNSMTNLQKCPSTYSRYMMHIDTNTNSLTLFYLIQAVFIENCLTTIIIFNVFDFTIYILNMVLKLSDFILSYLICACIHACARVIALHCSIFTEK